MKKRIVVGASGASGIPLLEATLKLIQESNQYESFLILSDSAKVTIKKESDCSTEELKALADQVLDINNMSAPPASGTFQCEGMIIVPCSMKTLAGIVSGYSDNLLLRVADVTIKEKRKLVLSTRESPLSTIHLRNMYELSNMRDVYIVPPMLTYYHLPKTVEDMTYHMAAKLVEPFGIEAKEYRRWNG